MSVAIESGIPIPPRYASRSASLPWDELDVGQSFHVSTEHPHRVRSIASVRSRDGSGRKFTTRKTPEGIRVWRTE